MEECEYNIVQVDYQTKIQYSITTLLNIEVIIQ